MSAPRPVRTVSIQCPSCQAPVWVDRALLLPCPDCSAAPGAPCTDLRGRTPRPRVGMHPARSSLLLALDTRALLSHAPTTEVS